MRTSAFFLAVALALTACQPERNPTEGEMMGADTLSTDTTAFPMAMVNLTGLGGREVTGTISFTSMGEGTRVEYTIQGLEPNTEHGFHVHQYGSCADSAGVAGGAAGAHFNPTNAPHGGPDAGADSRHVGDMGNVRADANGMASGSYMDNVIMLGGMTGTGMNGGDMNSIVGKAVIVHANRDDLSSQPSGDSGDRIACGVVQMGTETDMMPNAGSELGVGSTSSGASTPSTSRSTPPASGSRAAAPSNGTGSTPARSATPASGATGSAPASTGTGGSSASRGASSSSGATESSNASTPEEDMSAVGTGGSSRTRGGR